MQEAIFFIQLSRIRQPHLSQFLLPAKTGRQQEVWLGPAGIASKPWTPGMWYELSHLQALPSEMRGHQNVSLRQRGLFWGGAEVS